MYRALLRHLRRSSTTYGTGGAAQILSLKGLPQNPNYTIPVRSYAFSSADEAAAKRRLRIEPPIGALLRDATPRSAQGPPLPESESLFRDSKTTEFIIVTIPIAMAVSESSRLCASLKKEMVPVQRLIVNQVLPASTSGCKFCEIRRKFFDMPKHDAVKALNIYKKAGQQAEHLAEFYDFCRGLDLARTFQFPILRQPPPSFLATMEEYIKEAPQIGNMSSKRLIDRRWT